MRAVFPLLIVVLIAVATSTVNGRLTAGSGRTTLHMDKFAGSFRESKNPLAERAQMGWKQAGRTIPMNGGLWTEGAYFLNLTVGTGAGAISFNAIVDTGSSNTASPSVGCTSCGTQHLYNASASPTSKVLSCGSDMCQNCKPVEVGTNSVPAGGVNASCAYGPATCVKDQCAFGISYGGTSSGLSGTTVQDNACIGGTLCASDVYVNQITAENPAATQTAGIIGFAFPHNACNPTCQPTILDTMVAKGTLTAEENMFGMCLTNTNGGKMDIGYLNETRYKKGSMQYTKVVKEHWYNIIVKDFLINGETIGVPQYMYNIVNDGIGGFIDSGTSIVIVSPVAFTNIQSMMASKKYADLAGVTELFAQGNCAVLNASEIAAYPRMEFVVAGEEGKPDFHVGMDGHNYLMKTPGAPDIYCLGIAGVPSIGAILGDVIMENYYIAFDRYNSRVGFAPIENCQ